jgi:hypothetical protein
VVAAAAGQLGAGGTSGSGLGGVCRPASGRRGRAGGRGERGSEQVLDRGDGQRDHARVGGPWTASSPRLSTRLPSLPATATFVLIHWSWRCQHGLRSTWDPAALRWPSRSADGVSRVSSHLRWRVRAAASVRRTSGCSRRGRVDRRPARVSAPAALDAASARDASNNRERSYTVNLDGPDRPNWPATIFGMPVAPHGISPVGGRCGRPGASPRRG